MYFIVLNTDHINKSYLLPGGSNPIIDGINKEAGDNEFYPLPSELHEIAGVLLGLPDIYGWVKKRLTLSIAGAIAHGYINEWQTQDACIEGLLTDFVGWVLEKSMERGYPPRHEGPAVDLSADNFMYLANLIVRKKALRRNRSFRSSIYRTLAAIRASPYVSPYVLEAVRLEAREERQRSRGAHRVEEE